MSQDKDTQQNNGDHAAVQGNKSTTTQVWWIHIECEERSEIAKESYVPEQWQQIAFFIKHSQYVICLLYTSDAADDLLQV